MKNKVELIGHYGSDEIIALSAWTSTSRELSDDKRERIPKMLETLWFNGHETPFEKGVVHFLVDTDIATHIHLLKHRISSFNGESARYKELKEDKYYIPRDFDVSVPNSLREEGDIYGSETFNWANELRDFTEYSNRLYHQCLSDLTPVLGRKRAKESARFFKTYNSQIQGDVSFNMRSFSNFLNLRNSPHAQLEIRELAAEMVELVSGIEGSPFKHTLDVWERKGK
jgi:thymidylate synthase (FAD)